MLELVPCDFDDVKRFQKAAARDHVSVTNTKRTDWFIIRSGERDVGCCGLIQVREGRVRIKGIFVTEGARRLGLGTWTVELLEQLAREQGAKEIEVLAYNHAFYEGRGYRPLSQLRNGAWRLERAA